MPKFKVCVQQYVEETAVLWIDADTPEQAAQIGNHRARNGDVEDWHDGDDVMHQEVYAVLDGAGDIIWER